MAAHVYKQVLIGAHVCSAGIPCWNFSNRKAEHSCWEIASKYPFNLKNVTEKKAPALNLSSPDFTYRLKIIQHELSLMRSFTSEHINTDIFFRV